MFLLLFSFGLCVSVAFGSPEPPIGEDVSQDLSAEFKIMGGVLEECLTGEKSVSECLVGHGAAALGRALERDSIPLGPGLKLQRTSPDPPSVVEEARGLAAQDKLWHYLQNLFSTRSLTVDFSNLEEEGRGKKKKRLIHYMLVAAATAAAIMIPLKLKMIAAIAGKALMVGMTALVLASVVGLKKLVSKGEDDTTHVHYDTHRNDPTSHYLAYSAHANSLS